MHLKSKILLEYIAVVLHVHCFCVCYACCAQQECLDDIERALEHKYPDHLRHKVLVRRAQCVQTLGRHGEYTAAVAEARVACDALAPAKSKDAYFATLDALEQLQLKIKDPASSSSPAAGGECSTSPQSPPVHERREAAQDEMAVQQEDYEACCAQYNMFEGPNAHINFMSSALEMRSVCMTFVTPPFSDTFSPM